MSDAPERFNFFTWWAGGTTGGADMEPDNDGKWVRYTDHQTLIAEAVEAEREALLAEINRRAQDYYTQGQAQSAVQTFASALLAWNEDGDFARNDARAALNARDKLVREAALREAADICQHSSDKAERQGRGDFIAHQIDRDAIRALIDPDDSGEG